MAKRGYKLQEFVAHSANVNALSIGKKTRRLLVTGGDDHKVNIWAIGKPTSLMSLCGHSSPVECVAFDAAEVLVLAGASTGVIKQWDTEEAKIVRTLTGHKSNCTAVEFHPFGEFFASGSADTNLKIWDIRKKGCIHTYKGHARGISTIKFTPDGRWVVSGGLDNVVKVWDLTAGKLLHDFKFHEGPITSLDFHPLEFLLASGSADRTVKFWDLETFELIGSSRPEATGVRAITFHPDGRTLFCGSDDSLKVYSWEPVILHDYVDMGWSTLGDLCINEGKLLGCSSYQNSVGLWVADVSRIEPYGPGFVSEQNNYTDKNSNSLRYHPEKAGNSMRSVRCTSPDCDTSDIKTIYVDSTGGNPVVPQKVGLLSSPKAVLPLDPDEISDLQTEKLTPASEIQEKPDELPLNKSFVIPTILPRESPAGKDSSNSGQESITFSKTRPGMLLRPTHVRKPSSTKLDSQRMSATVESGSFGDIKRELSSAVQPDSKTRPISSDGARKSSSEKDSDIKTVTEKFGKVVSPDRPINQENCNEFHDCSKTSTSVKIVNGVAVVQGRTRSLVERFERRESLGGNEDKQTNVTTANMSSHMRLNSNEDQATSDSLQYRAKSNADQATNDISYLGLNNADRATNVTPHLRFSGNTDQATNDTSHMGLNNADRATNVTPHLRFDGNADQATKANSHMRFSSNADQATNANSHMRLSSNADQATNANSHVRLSSNADQATNANSHVQVSSNADQEMNVTPHKIVNNNADQATNVTTHVSSKTDVGQVANVSPLRRSNSNTEQATTVSPISRSNDTAVLVTDMANVMPHFRSNSNGDPATNISPLVRSNSISGRAANVSPVMRSNGHVEQPTNVSPLMRSNGNAERPTNGSPLMRSNGHAERPTNGSPLMRSNSHTERPTNVSPLLRSNDYALRATNVTPNMRSNRSFNQTTNSTRLARSNGNVDRATNVTRHMRSSSNVDRATNVTLQKRFSRKADISIHVTPQTRLNSSVNQAINVTPRTRLNGRAVQANDDTLHMRFDSTPHQATNITPHVKLKNDKDQATITTPYLIPEANERPITPKEEPQTAGRDTISANDVEFIENLMQTHEIFISTLRSRLTKLQVVRHFWQRNDIKGAIDATKKLPDHSVQADLITVLMEKTEILTLDLFSCVLPVLVNLLDSKMERHANISLEMLLKLVAVFGPVIRSTISAPPSVGVDLHAEERRECCNQCSIVLQKIQKVLPVLLKKGGLLAKSARELNLVLQES